MGGGDMRLLPRWLVEVVTVSRWRQVCVGSGVMMCWWVVVELVAMMMRRWFFRVCGAVDRTATERSGLRWDGDGGVGCGGTAAGEEREGKSMSGGEWCRWSGRSGDEEAFWSRSEKSAGKLFRRRRRGGRRWAGRRR
ncbi:hypothetical protein Tco_0332553 [Tanacetum coccineum]